MEQSTPPASKLSTGQDIDLVLPKVQLNHYTPKEPAIATVVKSELCTAAGEKSASYIRHVEFDVGDTKLARAFRAGQCFGVIPPGENEKGKPHKVRLYSIGSPTRGEYGKGGVISTAVKRVLDEDNQDHKLVLGIASNFLCDLDEGDTLKLTGPASKRFLLPENPQNYNYVFFATGTGIVPFRGLSIDLLEAGVKSSITLISGAPYSSDLCYNQEFQDLSAQHENFKYITAISRDNWLDPNCRMYVSDCIINMADYFSPIFQKNNTLVYMCGLTGMELSIYKALAQVLSSEHLIKYLGVDENIGRPDNWQRAMIGRQIKRTNRIFAEVYD